MLHSSRLADDTLAWNMTHQDCYTHLPTKFQHTKAPTTSFTIPKVEQSLVGPQAVRMDSFTMLRWDLVTHAGFPTFIHKDANGLCTWIFSHVGVKIWAILEPKYSTDHRTRTKQFALHKRMLDSPTSSDWDQASTMYTTFLAPGDMLYVWST
jgi:hypothetical protein